MRQFGAKYLLEKSDGNFINFYERLAYFGIMFVYNKLGWGSIASRTEVILMQFSLTEVVMLGMFLLALLTYLRKRK